MTVQFSPDESVLVAVAHPDDETFGCGSLIAAAVAAGAHVTVWCTTRGELGERRADPSTDHLDLAVVRERELLAAAELLGVHAVELEDHSDSGFDGDLPDRAFCSVPVDDVAAALVDRLESHAVDTLIVLDASDGHRDHRHMRAAAEQAVAATDRPVRILLACLSNRVMRQWVEEMRAVNPGTAYMDLDVDTLGTPDHLLTAIDTSAFYELRERAIACHRSQRSPFEGLSPGLRRAFLATDHVIEIPARA